MKDWVMATRPWSFPASAMPVVAMAAYLWWDGKMLWPMGAVWSLVSIVLFHAAANLLSDYRDYHNGVDHEDADCVRTLIDGILSSREVMTFSVVLMLLSAGIGIMLACLTHPLLIFVGGLGVMTGVFYTEMKYVGIGDFAIFMAYAVLPALGLPMAVSMQTGYGTLWLALPIGLITVAILHANNMRDTRTDADSCIRTLPMILGPRRSARVYAFEALFPFAWVAGCAAAGVFPLWSLASLLALPLAVRNVRVIFRATDSGDGTVANVDRATAQLQLAFSLLLAASFVAARLL